MILLISFIQVQLKLGKLEEALEEQNRQQKMLDDEVMDCSNKLKRAEMLISGLGGEKTRWTQIAKDLRATYNSLTGERTVLTVYFIENRLKIEDTPRHNFFHVGL